MDFVAAVITHLGKMVVSAEVGVSQGRTVPSGEICRLSMLIPWIDVTEARSKARSSEVMVSQD
jgi:hypothetical protein